MSAPDEPIVTLTGLVEAHVSFVLELEVLREAAFWHGNLGAP